MREKLKSNINNHNYWNLNIDLNAFMQTHGFTGSLNIDCINAHGYFMPE